MGHDDHSAGHADGASAAPFVSVVVPSYNEEGYIKACVDGLLGQDYPADRFEVIVADGGSSDRTREILDRAAERDARLSVVDNPARLQAAGLNAALRRARGEVVVRADVHADYPADYLRRCVEVLDETGADNAGGAARPRAKTAFQRAMCAALRSPLAFGGSKYRDERNEGWVESVFPGAFRRAIFERVGLFDPGAVTNEDAELNQRIWAAGGRVYLSPKIVVYYYPRDSFARVARQYFNYGQGRARTLLKHGRFLSPRPAGPFLFVSGTTALALVAPPLAAGVLAAYALATGIEALRVTRGEGAPASVVWAIFPVLHLAHGVGFGAGLLRYVRRPDWGEAEPLGPLTAPSNA